MDDETHQEGDNITFLFNDLLCEIVYLNNGLKVKVENDCGESAFSSYSYERSEGTITMNGSYTCIPEGDLTDKLSGAVSDLEDLLGATFVQSEWATNINWRNTVEWILL